MPITRDTSAAARQAQVDALRRMDGPTRLRMAMEMSEEGRRVTVAGIRHRHPDWNEAAVHEELLRLLLGRELSSSVLLRLRASP